MSTAATTGVSRPSSSCLATKTTSPALSTSAVRRCSAGARRGSASCSSTCARRKSSASACCPAPSRRRPSSGSWSATLPALAERCWCRTAPSRSARASTPRSCRPGCRSSSRRRGRRRPCATAKAWSCGPTTSANSSRRRPAAAAAAAMEPPSPSSACTSMAAPGTSPRTALRRARLARGATSPPALAFSGTSTCGASPRRRPCQGSGLGWSSGTPRLGATVRPRIGVRQREREQDFAVVRRAPRTPLRH
mmetsp:Transcript_30433/g.97096  ORF Transcript_30433/g.97096 Transcript_30433/m.97096 type:complete len:250 (+) Transcript_30433:157-906(+)